LLAATLVVTAAVAPTPPPPARPNDREAAADLLALERELQLAVLDRLAAVWRLRLGLPRAPVPDDDVAAAVLALRDDPLEVQILDRVVLDVDGHPALAGVERWPLRGRPGGGAG